MATRIEELYDQDFYVWTQRQAEALRRLAETRPNVGLDFPHLIEEVEDLGTSQRDAVPPGAPDHRALPEAGAFPLRGPARQLVRFNHRCPGRA